MATTVDSSYALSYGGGFGIVKPPTVRTVDYPGEQRGERIKICSKKE